MLRHFVPLDDITCTVRDKNRVSRIIDIPFRLVTGLLNDFVLIMAEIIARRCACQSSHARRISCKHLLIARDRGCRDPAAYPCHIAVLLKAVLSTAHLADIRHSTAHRLRRKDHLIFIPGLEQNRFARGPRLHQGIPDSSVDRLAEIASVRMLVMRPSCPECDPYIGQRSCCEDPSVLFFLYMCHDEPLPVSGKLVFRRDAADDDPASSHARLNYKMHLGIVPQRLKMPYSFKSIRHRLKVKDFTASEGDLITESVSDDLCQNLKLHLTHQTDLGLA